MSMIDRDEWDHQDKALLLAGNRADTTTHSGRMVSVTPSLLLTTGEHGQESAHLLAADTKFSKNGQPCSSADLRPGGSVVVTQSVRNAGVATLVEVLGDDGEMNCQD
jgi:hypothetical protein